MTLSARIKLIDDMVRENPDATIKDYLELVRELDTISISNETQLYLILLKKKTAIELNRKMDSRYKDFKHAHKL
jgi:hypothetical protein